MRRNTLLTVISLALGTSTASLAIELHAARQVGGNPPEAETITGLDGRSLAVCHGELLKKKGIESLMGCERSPVDDQTAQSYCHSYQAELSQRLQQAMADSASCPQGLATAGTYYRSMRALAVQVDTRFCGHAGHGQVVFPPMLAAAYPGANSALSIRPSSFN